MSSRSVRVGGAGGTPSAAPDAANGDHQPPLTERQLEILANVARGRTNRQIGADLGISEKTVRNHLRTIAHRLGTSDRTHAVVLAIGRGWIAIPIDDEARPAQVARVSLAEG